MLTRYNVSGFSTSTVTLGNMYQVFDNCRNGKSTVLYRKFTERSFKDSLLDVNNVLFSFPCDVSYHLLKERCPGFSDDKTFTSR